jgi:hypothetical protein
MNCPVSCQLCGLLLTAAIMTVGHGVAGRAGTWIGFPIGVALTGVLWRLFWWDDPDYEE